MKLFLYLYKNPFVWGSHLLGALIALYAPTNILTEHFSLKSFSTLIDKIFPIVGNYSSRSKFSEVTALYFAFMMCTWPIWFWRQNKLLTSKDTLQELITKTPGENHLLLRSFIAVLIFLPLVIFMLFINPGYQFSLMPINESRIALAVFGPFFAVWISSNVLASLIGVILFFITYCRNKKA